MNSVEWLIVLLSNELRVLVLVKWVEINHKTREAVIVIRVFSTGAVFFITMFEASVDM